MQIAVIVLAVVSMGVVFALIVTNFVRIVVRLSRDRRRALIALLAISKDSSVVCPRSSRPHYWPVNAWLPLLTFTWQRAAMCLPRACAVSRPPSLSYSSHPPHRGLPQHGGAHRGL